MSDAVGDVAERGADVAVAARNAPFTAVTVGVNSATGGNCDLEEHLMVVCYGGAVSRLSDHTFTIGNTVNTTAPDGSLHDSALLRHEIRHAHQWSIFGAAFPALYGLNYVLSDAASGTQCWNVFEWQAGFEDGGYDECRGFGQC